MSRQKIGAGAGRAFLRQGLKELQAVFSMGSQVPNEPGSLGTPTIQSVDRQINQSGPQSSLSARLSQQRVRTPQRNQGQGRSQ